MSVDGMVEDAVNGDVPLPFTYPVKVPAPVPPTLTDSVPEIAVDGTEDQIPSPLQNVPPLAEVPELNLEIWRFPVRFAAFSK